MLFSKIIDGLGRRFQAAVNAKNELLTQARAIIADYEPQGLPFTNQVNRVRTAEGQSRFEGRFFYGLNTDFWLEAENVNGTRVYSPTENGVKLQVAGTTGDKISVVTRDFFPYQPDTVVHAATAIAFELKQGIIQFWGLASFQGGIIKDGYILRNNDGSIEFVKYSSVGTGIPSQSIIPRALWDDPMDGTGESGLALDFNDLQMAEIAHAWYGGGSAKLQFRIKGKTYIAHIFSGANNKSKFPIIANPVLSVMYGLEATKTTGVTESFQHYGLSVTTDGDFSATGKPFAVVSPRTTVAGGSWTPVLSIRLKSTFSIDGAAAKPNVYGYITSLLLSVHVDSREADIAFVRDSALTGASFGNITDITGAGITESMVEFDTSATAFTGGIPFEVREVERNGEVEISVAQQDTIAVDSLGTGSTVLTVAARPAAGGNAIITAGLNWREIY